MKADPTKETISEADKAILWSIHTRKVRELKAKAKEIKKLIDDQTADAKNDGFDKKEVLDYVDVMTSDDQKKHITKFNMMKRNRIRLGLIPDDRGGDLLADRATREQLIEADGYECGLNGFERVSKQSAGSADDKLWLKAYQRGQDDYGQNWQRVMEEKKARREAEEAASSKESPPATGEDPFSGFGATTH
jgi:uncharacterized protein (UPF0335 family)